MLAWLKGAKPTKDYSAEQQTMPARMEKKKSINKIMKSF